MHLNMISLHAYLTPTPGLLQCPRRPSNPGLRLIHPAPPICHKLRLGRCPPLSRRSLLRENQPPPNNDDGRLPQQHLRPHVKPAPSLSHSRRLHGRRRRPARHERKRVGRCNGHRGVEPHPRYMLRRVFFETNCWSRSLCWWRGGRKAR